MKVKIFLKILPLILLLTACVKEPTKPYNPDLKSGDYLILCEGLLGSNNASISLLNAESKQIQNLYFETANNGLKIGDTANDLVFKNDTAYITVTASGSIESFNKTDGKWLNRLYREGSSPIKTVIINDTTAYATDLYNDSLLLKYNPKTMEYIGEVKFKGKNPEGIASDGKRLFVANTGLGEICAEEKYAGTLSVIDLATDTQTETIEIGTNLVELLIVDDKMYLCYYNLYSIDAPGGVVELNLSNLQETNRIEGFFRSICHSEKENRLYFIEDIPRMDIVERRGVSYVNLDLDQWEATQAISNDKLGEYWYTLAIDDLADRIIVGNAMNFSVAGKVMIFNADTLEAEYKCGVSPSEIRVLN